MKTIEVGKLKLQVCTNKGDISYERFVAFKQYAPQFWEKMDSPLFESYWERIKDFHNRGMHVEAIMKLHDYKIAIDNAKNGADAWGICFALISEVSDGDAKQKFKTCPNDADIQEKIKLYNSEGLMADVVEKCVLDFMKASPVTFLDQLIHYDSQRIASEVLV